MKKKILSAVIAGIIVLTTITPTIQVSAAPADTNTAADEQNEYEKLKVKVNEEDEKVQAFDNQISGLVIKIEDNNKQIDNINKEVENTNKEIEQTKIDISEKEDVLGKRLREVYKTGGQTNYLSLIFSADSFGDLISKIDTAGRLVKIDKKVVQEVKDNKNKLDEKVESLGTKAKETQSLNEDIEKQKSNISEKKEEQKVVAEQAKAQKEEFDSKYLVPAEREVANKTVEYYKSLNNLSQLIDGLRTFRSGLKSQTVINEVNNVIEDAKKKAEEQSKAKVVAPVTNRGNVPVQTSDIVAYARQFLGRPYVYGATGPSTFDCSGFTSYVYMHARGIDIGRTTYAQIDAGREVSASDLQPGDLVFPHADHVQIYIGNGLVIHAPHTGDVVKIAELGTVWRARRIIN